MNKRYILNILALLFSFSAFAVKPNVQRTHAQHVNAQHKNVKSTQVSARTHKESPSTIHTDTIPSNAHEKHLTIGESWSKFLRLKWTSLSRHDAWNIGASIVMCGALVYLSLDALIDPDAGNNEDRTCNICLDTKKGYEFCTLSCCGHNTACVECLQEMMDASLQEKKITEIKCPNQNCARAINNRNVRKIVKNRPDMYKAYNDVTKEEYVAKHGIHCPTPDCTYALMNKNGRKSFNCPQCKKTYCIECARQHPTTISCKQAKLTDEKQANDEWIQNHSKKCPQCKKDIEKNEGCNHMTCKCSHEFCWECLGSWKPKTCTCPIFPAAQNNNQINNQQHGNAHNELHNNFDEFLRQRAINRQQNNQRNNNHNNAHIENIPQNDRNR